MANPNKAGRYDRKRTQVGLSPDFKKRSDAEEYALEQRERGFVTSVRTARRKAGIYSENPMKRVAIYRVYVYEAT